ncbi:MAG: hypothetical protein GTO22_01575 [Gemmatimonadales bacterium]|nr:hypothetical protein [Gemmatimonadales bacterium]
MRVTSFFAVGHVVWVGTAILMFQVTHRQQRPCPAAGEGRVRLSEDSVAYLPVRAPLAKLLKLCPQAIETPVVSVDLHRHAGLRFVLGAVTAHAVQQRPELDLSEPPSYWLVEGHGWELPSGVTSGTTWSELQSQYGEAYGSTELGALLVAFCRFPWLMIILDVQAQVVGSPEVSHDLSRVPSDAGIRVVEIGAGPRLSTGYLCGRQ